MKNNQGKNDKRIIVPILYDRYKDVPGPERNKLPKN